LLDKVFGPLAQLVEQLTLNQLVVGSIPTRPTISASIVKNLRGTHASIKIDVVLLSAGCAITE
jgi:general stress protein CsbA